MILEAIVQGVSSDFATTIQKPHTAVVAAEVVRNGKVAADLEVHAGSVTADRTAAQMRTMQFEIIDRDGALTPTGMTSLLAPFGTRIQLYRGVRIKNVDVLSAVYSAANPWTPQTPTGVMSGVKIDSSGNLVLGP